MATRQLTIFDVKLPIDHMNFENAAERRIEIKLRLLVDGKRTWASENNVPFDLGVMFLRTIMTDRCPYLGVPLSYIGTADNLHRASLDRIVPERGYVAGNVRFISVLANWMKRDATIPQLVAFAKGILHVHGEDGFSGLTEGLPLSLPKRRRKRAS